MSARVQVRVKGTAATHAAVLKQVAARPEVPKADRPNLRRPKWDAFWREWGRS